MKRMKFFLLALALIFVLSAAFGCAKKEDKTFTVGFDADFPPYGYIDENGEYIGFDLDLAAEVCTRRGWTLKLSPIDWNSKDFELESGAIDCIWNGFTITEERKEALTFSEPYVKNMQVVVIKAENADVYTDTASLSSANLVAEVASTGEGAIAEDENLSKANYVSVAKQADALLEVKAGTADAAVIDYVMARAMVGEGTDYADLIMIEGLELSYEEYGIGFRLGSNVAEKVNEATAAIIENGTLPEIAAKYGLALMAD